MYVPKFNEEHRRDVLQALMRANPLGTWVTLTDNGLMGNAIPFLLDDTRGEFGTLCCHVARANPLWQSFSPTVPSLVVFQGANAYISPSWYPSKHEHGKAVPTWNYMVVQAHGLPKVQDEAWLRRHVTALTDTHESKQALPWQVSDAPSDYIDTMLQHIVGIEIPITRLTGKWKLGQNRPKADQLGIVAGLTARSTASAQAVADALSQHMAKP